MPVGNTPSQELMLLDFLYLDVTFHWTFQYWLILSDDMTQH